MVALFLALVIQQATHGRGIFFARLITVDQNVPLDPHPAGKFYQRLESRLGKFNHLDAFRIKMVAALARQFVDDPGFRLSFHQQPAAGKERRRAVKANMKRDTPPVFRVQSPRA
ncbi:Uncharacterised protein [Klebsiella pneumoniae]|nr:Uncharacterised protein [Klebsiella pneumoniae]